MKEIKSLNKVYLEEYGVYVKQYLSYAEVQNIVNQVVNAKDWANQQTIIDMMILAYATGENLETLESVGHNTLLDSGLIYAVEHSIVNIGDIYEALSCERSFVRIVAKHLPEIIEKLKNIDVSKLNKQGE